MNVDGSIAKVIGAFVLFTATFLVTILPTKLRNVQEKTLKSVSCFCGGLFLGLCFLHLIPDVLRAFKSIPTLNDLQEAYPMAEFTICVGLMVVMTAEKLVEVLENRKETQKCDASKECCTDSCRMKANIQTPLLQKLQSSYSASDSSITLESQDLYDGRNKTDDFDDFKKSDDTVKPNKSFEDADKRFSKSAVLLPSTAKTTTRKLRTLCLIIALMVHSLFEGLTVGLQKSIIGLITLVSLLAFHKCIIGFSLGITIVKANQSLKLHLIQAALFSAASPVGIFVGLIIFSSNLLSFNDAAVSLLTALATGSFIYITFFELLARDLQGFTLRDFVNYACFLFGFVTFASITSIKRLQT